MLKEIGAVVAVFVLIAYAVVVVIRENWRERKRQQRLSESWEPDQETQRHQRMKSRSEV
mgnify:CR=1 FL=1